MQHNPILYGILQHQEKHFPVKMHFNTYIWLTQINPGYTPVSIPKDLHSNLKQSWSVFHLYFNYTFITQLIQNAGITG